MIDNFYSNFDKFWACNLKKVKKKAALKRTLSLQYIH